ncbi:MAG: SIS domain-containing protein [Archaeoglobaceae archaeon]
MIYQKCGKVPYINTVHKNVMNLKKSEVNALYQNISEAECIIPVGEGRSQCALYIGLRNIKRDVKMIEAIDFPGENMYEAAEILEKKYKKISLLVNSGSGETTNPKRVVEELKSYIDKSGSDSFTIDSVVSNPDSSIGKVSKEYGSTVILEGRGPEVEIGIKFMQHGIMNDIYELGSLMLFHEIREMVNSNGNENIFDEMDRDTKDICGFIDNFVGSDTYNSLIDNMEKRGHVIVGGTGIARVAALMSVIRFQHVKRAIGDEAYLTGSLAPRPRAGDTVILVSWSGENETLMKWMKESKRFGANVYSITGRKSTLSDNTDSFVLLSDPSEFYMKAAFVLSPISLSLVDRLDSRGLKLPEYIMGWYHSVTQ